MSERLLHPAIFSIILQSDPVHVFQSILLNQPRLKFIPIYLCTYSLDLSRFERQISREKESKSVLFFSSKHMRPLGSYFSDYFSARRGKRPRIVDVFGALGTKLNSKMALRRHGWFFSHFSSILQG